MYYVACNSFSVISFFVVCTDVRDDDGDTPLHYACNNGYLEVVKYFVETTHCDVGECSLVHAVTSQTQRRRHCINQRSNQDIPIVFAFFVTSFFFCFPLF